MKIEFCTANFNWQRAPKWEGEFFTMGTYIGFSQDLVVFDCPKEEALAMIFPAYRYGIAYEIYGIAGPIAGIHLGYFPEACRAKKSGQNIDKRWVLENWNSHFKHTLPMLDYVWFSYGN